MFHVSHSAHTTLHYQLDSKSHSVDPTIMYFIRPEDLSSWCVRESATLLALARTVNAWTYPSLTLTLTAFKMLTFKPASCGGRRETSSSESESPHEHWRRFRRMGSMPRQRNSAWILINSHSVLATHQLLPSLPSKQLSVSRCLIPKWIICLFSVLLVRLFCTKETQCYDKEDF